jgi:hypothetical protein
VVSFLVEQPDRAFMAYMREVEERAILKRAAAIDLVQHQRAGRTHYDA